MKMAISTMKYGRWLPLLAACILFGCASGPQPQGARPLEPAKETGNLANFGDAPKPLNPASAEPLGLRIPLPSPPETPAPKDPPPSLPTVKPDSGRTENQVTREYDFTVSDIKIVPPQYLPSNAVSTTYDITAFNWGNAPVSVAIGIDAASSRNVSTDKALPLTAVVAPNTNQAVVHVGPKMKNEAFDFRYSYAWSIGDYTARHRCPERYRFPFGENVQAFAGVTDSAKSTPYTRYAVVFSLPAGTPVRAARKGTVVRITAGEKIDILHDDSTIATYSHLGKIADGMIAGRAVSTTDIIGIAGEAGNQKDAYVQLTVWRPEPSTAASLKTGPPGPGFELVSVPLEFCGADSGDCGVLSQSQEVSRNKGPETKKQENRPETKKQENRKVRRATRNVGSM